MDVQFFVQMISANQNSKLKRTVKKRAIFLMYNFLFSISKKNFWFQRHISLLSNLSGILDEGIDILRSIGAITSG